MPVGSYTATPLTVTTVTHNSNTVTAIKPAASNTAAHPQTRPDDGRIVMRQPNGVEYTNVPSVVQVVGSTTVTLIKEGV